MMCGKVLCIDGDLLNSQKEIRDQMCSLSAGDTAHTGSEESAGLCLPPALFRLHRVQEATGHRWRVLSDGGQQAGLQGRLRDRQTERWGSTFTERPNISVIGFDDNIMYDFTQTCF